MPIVAPDFSAAGDEIKEEEIPELVAVEVGGGEGDESYCKCLASSLMKSVLNFPSTALM